MKVQTQSCLEQGMDGFGDLKSEEGMKIVVQTERGTYEDTHFARAEQKRFGKVNYTWTVHINKINMSSPANGSLLKMNNIF